MSNWIKQLFNPTPLPIEEVIRRDIDQTERNLLTEEDKLEYSNLLKQYYVRKLARLRTYPAQIATA